MKKLDYEELYTLLYNMKRSNSIRELSNRMYCSSSKTSKMINYYEKKLKIQIHLKNEEHLLSEEGEKILEEIKVPLQLMQKIVHKDNNTIGVDENLIEDKIPFIKGQEYRYMNSKELLEEYKSGVLNKIIISSDYEDEIDFMSKSLIVQKPLYFIKKKNCKNNTLYANAIGCPIAKKLEKENIEVDEYLTQSVAICKMVREGRGGGYTFSVDTLDPEQIDIKLLEEMKIGFFMYNKY